jgi:hypothetical protein
MQVAGVCKPARAERVLGWASECGEYPIPIRWIYTVPEKAK